MSYCVEKIMIKEKGTVFKSYIKMATLYTNDVQCLKENDDENFEEREIYSENNVLTTSQ